ncbi:DUF899 domain-containing protein [Streptomyces sp. NPDC090306]|uniref:DUF899 domain-containing protein n=1 Tax=Streptomyces sp. NPDC090306 TaxID=3365961 RepID=UPI003807118C
MSLPEIVSREQWLAAREELLVEEKAATRARDALNARRRRLPMVEVEEEYLFEGGDGKATLLDLFDGRHQLVVHHFAFAPGWEAGCRCCSAFLDQVGHLSHLHARDTSFVVVSRAPYTRILPFKARMGWSLPWYSSYGGDFNHDFGATVAGTGAEAGGGTRRAAEGEASGEPGEAVERSGVSCFLRDRERVFHTYTTRGRGLDGLGPVGSLLDLTALGRQEEWEEPPGRAGSLGTPAGREALRYHDEYEY